MRTRAIPLLLILLVLSGIGCGKKTSELDAVEERLPLMEEAKRRVRAQDIDGGIELYLQLLDERPRLATAHLQVGLLIDQYKEDYVGAIYHYRRYLELRPEAEKRPLVEELIRLARLSFATSLPDQPSEAIQELARQKEQMDTLEQDLATARERIEALKATLAEVRRRTAAAAQPPQGQSVGAAVSAGAPAPGIPAEPRTYTVRKGDTLSRIAGKVYNDPGKWRAIYDANRETMRKSSDLKVGQVLTLPDL